MSSTEKEVLLSDDSDKKSISASETTNGQAAEATSNDQSAPNGAAPSTQPPSAPGVVPGAPNGTVVVRRQGDQFQSLFGPMLDELEQAVNSNMAELDKLEETFMGDSKRKRAEEMVAHIPREIRYPRPINAVMHNLERLLLDLPIEEPVENGEASEQNGHASTNGEGSAEAAAEREPAVNQSTSKLGRLNQIVCMAHSLSAYLITVDSRKHGEHIRNVTSKLYDDVNLWLAHLFRFTNSSVFFHDQESDGLVRMCNMLFNLKFQNYQKEGFAAIKKPPTIYISASSKYAIADYKNTIAVQLGIPTSCIRLVKVHKTLDNMLDKIDLQALMAQIDEDVAAGFTPLTLVANAGSYATGQCDNIEQLYHICYKYHMWLHIEGIYLSSLVLYSVPTAIQPVSSGDSITLNLASWLGIPSLSNVTLYRNVEDSGRYIQPFNSAYSTLHKCLPYWCALQVIGHGGVMERIKYATDVSTFFRNTIVRQKPFLKVLNFKDQNSRAAAPTLTGTGFSGIIAKALSYLTFVDLTQPIVIFKCDQAYVQQRLFLLADKFEKQTPAMEPLKQEFMNIMQDDGFLNSKLKKKASAAQADAEPTPPPKSKFTDEVNEYTDTITTWLCDLLNSIHKNMELELVEIQDEGTCIRYSPIEHANTLATDEKDLAAFSKSMEDMIKILDSSIKCKSTFESDMKQFQNLVPVNVPKWAGVGAVRFMPDYLSEKAAEIMKYQDLKVKAKKRADEKAKKEAEASEEEAKEPQKTEEEPSTSAEAKAEDAQTKPAEAEEAKASESPAMVEQKSEEPEEFVADEAMEKRIREINSINEQLVKKLQAEDGAFSIGEAADGMLAVKFGMINESSALKALALQVQDAGREVEESSRFIETMSELVRQGIEKATEDLKKAKELKVAQQGLLNQIPIVGSLMSWFSSPPVEPKAGRTFNLQSGKIASTELTHKYHMQVEEGETDELAANGNGEHENGEHGENSESSGGESSIKADQIKNKLISNHIVNSQRAGRRQSTDSARSNVSSVGINVNGIAQNGE